MAMTKGEVVKLLTLIESVYSHFLVKDETVLLWFQFCSRMDYKQVMAKLKKHIRKSPFPPTITDIAVFPCDETDLLATLQESMQKGRKRIERERNQTKRISIPDWLVEYSTRKSM